jgi:hypothetical protein
VSDLLGPANPAGDPGAAENSAPPLPDDFLLSDFLQVRALAQHAGVIARLDAFAAAHGAATDDDPDTPSVVTGGPTAPEPDFDLAGDDAMPLGLRLQLAGSGNSNTILAGYVQSQGAQSLFESTCGGGSCHTAPSAPPTLPTPYFPQEEGSAKSAPNPPPSQSQKNQDQIDDCMEECLETGNLDGPRGIKGSNAPSLLRICVRDCLERNGYTGDY